MSVIPPLQVTVDVKDWSCILDVRLALSRYGLMLALRLAEELKVYLVPALWAVLDNTAYYERHPGYLAGDPLLSAGPLAGGECGMALAQWETARLELGLSALRVYWAGDALHESSLPKEVDAGAVGRFERLAEGLERRLADARPELESGHPLLDGSRDAAALAAAMARYRPIILTLGGESHDAEPPLCRLLQACGIPCRGLEAERAGGSRAYLMPLLARCGVLELTWAGLHLAAVHLVTPRTFLMPPLSGEASDPPALDAAAEDWWQDAAAFWYPLS